MVTCIKLLALIVQLSSVSLAFTQTNVTFAYIGTGRDADFDQYAATIVGTSDDQTTYNLGCPSATSSATPCLAKNLPPFTLISGPSTYEFVFSNYQIYSKTACVLTGSPQPTTGTCTETWTNHILTYSQSSEITFTVPNTASAPFVGVHEATLVVVASGTTVATTDGSASGSTATATATTNGGASESTTTGASSSGSVSGTATGPVKTGTTPNLAKRTVAPMAMVVGAVAGVAFGL